MTCTGCEIKSWPRYWGDYVRERVHVCASCPHRLGDRCGVISASGKPGIILHPLGVPHPSASCPLGRFRPQPTNNSNVSPQPKTLAKQVASQPIDLESMVSNACSCADVAIVTIHYNPLRYRRLRETYLEWLPTLGPLANCLQTYELVFDDDEPEIPGSIVIRGTREKNFMWQKEPLINIALAATPPNVKYVAWLDHDLVFENIDWLNQAIAKLEAGAVAVQLFDQVIRLNHDRSVQSIKHGSVSKLLDSGKPIGCPGGAWIADRAYLDSIGGLNTENLFGGGDQTFLDAMIGTPGSHLNQYSPLLSESLKQWILEAYQHVGNRSVSYVPGKVYHLWHGEMSGRQYSTRYKILKQSDFDPNTDIRINQEGLLEWSSAKPSLHRAIARFFNRRREDG